jgi:hypothetical protein
MKFIFIFKRFARWRRQAFYNSQTWNTLCCHVTQTPWIVNWMCSFSRHSFISLRLAVRMELLLRVYVTPACENSPLLVCFLPQLVPRQRCFIKPCIIQPVFLQSCVVLNKKLGFTVCCWQLQTWCGVSTQSPKLKSAMSREPTASTSRLGKHWDQMGRNELACLDPSSSPASSVWRSRLLPTLSPKTVAVCHSLRKATKILPFFLRAAHQLVCRPSSVNLRDLLVAVAYVKHSFTCDRRVFQTSSCTVLLGFIVQSHFRSDFGHGRSNLRSTVWCASPAKNGKIHS